MNALSQFLIKARQNKLFVVVVIGICLGVIEFTTHLFSDTTAKLSGNSGGQVVAVVQTVQTDVRQKPVEEQGWYRAEPQTEVMRGDAIYSGRQSRSQVRMMSGGILELGEETLVIFDDIDGVTIPDASRGQVKLKVSGQMKVAIGGEVTEFSGAQSELLLNLDGTSRNIRVTKGHASIARKGVEARSLTTGEVLELPAVKVGAIPKIQIPKVDDLVSEAKISEKRKIADPQTTPLKPVEFTEPVVEAPTPAPAPVQPASIEPPQPEVVQQAVEPPPPPAPIVKEALSVQDPAMKVNRIMKVHEVYARNGKTSSLIPRAGMKTLKVPVALSWNGTEPADKVFVQVSKDKSFEKPWAEREAAGGNVVIDEWKPGRNYYRVSRDKQSWSEAGEVVVKPTVAPAQLPSVTVLNDQLTVYPKGKGPEAQAKLRFEDIGLSKPRGWVLQGSNAANFDPKKTRTVYVKEARVDIPLRKEGRYFFRVRSVASAGEISSFSEPIEVRAVKPAPVPVRLAEKQKEARKVATVEEKQEEPYNKEETFKQEPETARQTSKMETTTTEKPDDRVRPWSIAIEGGETALVSSDSISDSSEPAATHVIGLKAKYQNERNSGSIAYRTKFGGTNAEGNSQSNSRLELRYTRWWQTRWKPIRLGWTGGFESYRNPTATRFSKGYDAAKTGLDVGITLSEKWKTGGDILVGTWTDANKVYEFGGFLSYDFTRELAFGVGYRLSLFDAAVEGSAPIALPYREAMGEAYSSLQFSF